MPTFCSLQPEVTLKRLTEDEEYAFDCLQALVARLLARRELTAEEAREYSLDPREGDFRKVLRRSWSTPRKRSSEEKGKTTKGRPAKNQKSAHPDAGEGPSNAAQGTGKKTGLL